MPKFRKKPIVIEAFQMTKERRWDNKDWPNWLNEAWNKDWREPGAVYCGDGDGNFVVGRAELIVRALEGFYMVSWNDWIIRGIKGELYPCKPDIFEATYELVPETHENG